MKQTALEWFMEQVGYKCIMDVKELNDILEQAKAMEKKQIIDALMTSEVELLCWGISAEQYYNETFKSE